MPLLTHTYEPTRPPHDRLATIRFCSRCGGPDDPLAGRPERCRRVCDRCGMGVMLTSTGDALPGPGAAFMVVTAELAVSAVSRSGDKLFGEEGELTGSHLLAIVTCPLGRRPARAARPARRRAPLRDRGAARAAHVRRRAAGRHAVGAHRDLRLAARGAGRGRAERLRYSLAVAAEQPACRLRTDGLANPCKNGCTACDGFATRRQNLHPRTCSDAGSSCKGSPRLVKRAVDVRSSAATLTRLVDREVK